MARFLIGKDEETQIVLEKQLRLMERKAWENEGFFTWRIIEKLRPLRMGFKYTFIKFESENVHRYFMYQEGEESHFVLDIHNTIEREEIPDLRHEYYLKSSYREIVEYLKLPEGIELEFEKIGK